MDTDVFENAIVAWLKTSVGPDVEVRLSDQEAPQPADGTGEALPFCTVRLMTLAGESLHTMQTQDVDDARPMAEQMEVAHSRPMNLSVRVQAFTPLKSGPAWAVPMLVKASTELGLRTVRANLRAAGLGLFDIGAVQNLTGLMSVRWEGRAALELQFHVVATAQERMGYITEAGAAVSISQG